MNIVMLDNQIRDHIVMSVTNLFKLQIDSAEGNADHIRAGEAYYSLIYRRYQNVIDLSKPPLVTPTTKLVFIFNTIGYRLPLSGARMVFANFTAQQLRPELFLLGDKAALKNNPETREFMDAFNAWHLPVSQAIRRSERWNRDIRLMINGCETVNQVLDFCPPFIDIMPDYVKRALLRGPILDSGKAMNSEMVKATAEVVTLLVSQKVTGNLPPLPRVSPTVGKGPDIPVTVKSSTFDPAFVDTLVTYGNVVTVSSMPSPNPDPQLFADILNKVNHAST